MTSAFSTAEFFAPPIPCRNWLPVRRYSHCGASSNAYCRIRSIHPPAELTCGRSLSRAISRPRLVCRFRRVSQFISHRTYALRPGSIWTLYLPGPTLVPIPISYFSSELSNYFFPILLFSRKNRASSLPFAVLPYYHPQAASYCSVGTSLL